MSGRGWLMVEVESRRGQKRPARRWIKGTEGGEGRGRQEERERGGD